MKEIYPFNEYNKNIFYSITFMIFTIITCYFLASSRVKLILRRDVIILDKWFSDSKEICEHPTSRGDHRMSYAHLPVENLDKKQSVKG